MHKFFFLIIFVIAQLAFSCQPKAAAESSVSEVVSAKDILVPYRDGDRWGFARPDGSIVVKPTYDQVYVYSDGYGRTYTKDITGLVAPDGTVLLQPTYASIGDFTDGLATVYTTSGQHGYIDTKGKVVIATVYEEAYSFQNNRGVVKKSDKYLLINRSGEVVANLGSDLMPTFGDVYMESGVTDLEYDPGYLLVQRTDNYLMGLIDTNGRTILKPIYSSLSLPMKGAMIASNGDLSGLINVTGKEIIPMKYNYIYPIGQAQFVAQVVNTKTEMYESFLLDAKGQPILKGSFTTLYQAQKDYFVASRDSLLGVLDLSGKEVIPFRYQGIASHFDLFVVYENQTGKAGVVNLQNKTMLPTKYDEIEVLSPTRFLVTQGNKRGLMDANGKWILQPEYDLNDIGGDYHEGMAAPELAQHSVLLAKQGVSKLYNLDGKLLSDKVWLYSGYMDPNGFMMLTDCNSRESMVGPDGRIFSKDPVLKSVTVRTVQELCKAIADDVEIILEDGKYDLGIITDTTKFVRIFDFGFEDRTVLIHDVRNLHIKAKNPGKAEIVVTYAYVPVVKLQYCQNVSFTGIVMGHDINPGHCDGAVVSTDGCTYLVLDNCDLYGSGTYGIEASTTNHLFLRNTTIRECTRGIVWLENTGHSYFTNCIMRDNMGADMVNLVGAYNIVFDKITFENNNVPTEWGPYDFFRFEDCYQAVELSNSVFKNCSADYFLTDSSLLEETNNRKEGLTIHKANARQESSQFDK